MKCAIFQQTIKGLQDIKAAPLLGLGRFKVWLLLPRHVGCESATSTKVHRGRVQAIQNKNVVDAQQFRDTGSAKLSRCSELEGNSERRMRSAVAVLMFKKIMQISQWTCKRNATEQIYPQSRLALGGA